MPTAGRVLLLVVAAVIQWVIVSMCLDYCVRVIRQKRGRLRSLAGALSVFVILVVAVGLSDSLLRLLDVQDPWIGLACVLAWLGPAAVATLRKLIANS